MEHVVCLRPRILRRTALAAALAATIAATAPAARGAEPVPSPAPFALPVLSHDRLDARLDWLVGGLGARDAGRPAAVAALVRPSIESSVLLPRRLFVGLRWPIAAALPPDGGLAPGEAARPAGTRALVGNAEAHVRVLFPLPTSIEVGFALGASLPTATFHRDARAGRSAAEAVASLSPTDLALFRPGRLALRPAGDLRVVRGAFVLQGRHGVDVIIDPSGRERVKAAGRLLGHVGFLVRPDLEVSLEAEQLYVFSSDARRPGGASPDKVFAERYRISDDRRSAVSIGPGIRLALPGFDVGAAVTTNLGAPLSPATSGFVALNLSVAARARAPR